MPQRRVLIVAYDFPPAGGSGVQRALKLARYLPDSGWRPTILCCGHHRLALRDETLVGDLPINTDIVRLNGWEPPGLTKSFVEAIGLRVDSVQQAIDWRANDMVARLGLPEPQLLWSLAACRAAIDVIHCRHIEAVITTGPPHSVHWVGRTVQKRTGTPWIADLRDPILANFAYRPANRLADSLWRSLESTIVRHADQIVVTCDDLAQELRKLYRSLGGPKIETITNGWDPIDFPTSPRQRTSTSIFALTYVGAFYRDQSIEPFLEAFRRLLIRRPDLRHRLRFEHVGTLSREQTRLLRSTDDEFLVRRGYAHHHEAIAAMRAADALLLTVPPTPGGRLCIPAKTFEYLATGRPILAFAHSNSHLAQLLSRAGGATLLPNCGPDTIAAAVESLAAHAAADRPSIRRCPTTLRETSRQVLAARYAVLLDQAAGLSRSLNPRSPAQYWHMPRATA